MKKNIYLVILLALVAVLNLESCRRSRPPSGFVQSSLKLTELEGKNHRIIKQNAVGESAGAVFIWMRLAHPTEAEAKQDMLQHLEEEGIDIKGKRIVFTNATSDRGGFSLIGLIGSDTITLTADVVELLNADVKLTTY